jgi:hypothetical protein
MLKMSSDAEVIVLPTADIGGTDTATIDATYWGAAHDVRGWKSIYAKLRVGTWNAADDVDTLKLQQCTDATGSDAKDLTTSGSGATYDYNTAYPLDAVTNTAVLEADVADMDIAGGFYYVRLYAAETGNTGTDDVAGVIILYDARDQYAQREGAAAAGETVYIRA